MIIPSELSDEERWRRNGKYVSLDDYQALVRDKMNWVDEGARLRDENAELRLQLAGKESDRRYHMNAINRLAKFLALSGTSDAIVDAAMDNMARFARALSEVREQLAEANKTVVGWSQLVERAETAERRLAEERAARDEERDAARAAYSELSCKFTDWERRCLAAERDCRAERAAREADQVAMVNYATELRLVVAERDAALGHAMAITMSDKDGHCTVCGLPWLDERETLEPHVCPPGFQRSIAPDA